MERVREAAELCIVETTGVGVQRITSPDTGESK